MKRKLIKSTIIFCSYFIYSYLAIIPYYLIDHNADAAPLVGKMLYLFATNTIYLCFVLMAYHKDITNYYNDFKKNGNIYLHQTLKYWYIGLGIMIVANAIINRLSPNGIPENEEAVRAILREAPLYTVFSAVIYAPIVEEIICRKLLKDIISNKWFFVIISGFIFGGAHVFSSYTSIWDLLYIISYGALGSAFALAYYKTNNLITSMSLHALHNSMLMILYLSLM